MSIIPEKITPLRFIEQLKGLIEDQEFELDCSKANLDRIVKEWEELQLGNKFIEKVNDVIVDDMPSLININKLKGGKENDEKNT